MLAEDAIMHALRRRPMSQRELCAATGYTDRHIRRVLKTLPDVVATRSGRATIYSYNSLENPIGIETQYLALVRRAVLRVTTH